MPMKNGNKEGARFMFLKYRAISLIFPGHPWCIIKGERGINSDSQFPRAY